MLNTAPKTSRVLRARHVPDPRPPHPSWRNGHGVGSGDHALAIRDAGDFWSRLGL